MHSSIVVKEFPSEYKCQLCERTLPISKFRRYRYGETDFSFKPVCTSCLKIHSSVYLGVTVAEKVLSNVFSNVQRMPAHNHGYDFICGKGYKVDAKAACYNQDGAWSFNINQNKTADYFACLAFDNRWSLTPLHFWLIPGNAEVPYKRSGKVVRVDSLSVVYVRPPRVGRWKEYEKPVDKILTACDIMKHQKEQPAATAGLP